VVTLKF